MIKKLIIKIIETYQVFFSFDRGLLAIFAPGGACRYPISCSEYTKRAISHYGVVKGFNLGLQRIWRCR